MILEIRGLTITGLLVNRRLFTGKLFLPCEPSRILHWNHGAYSVDHDSVLTE